MPCRWLSRKSSRRRNFTAHKALQSRQYTPISSSRDYKSRDTYMNTSESFSKTLKRTKKIIWNHIHKCWLILIYMHYLHIWGQYAVFCTSSYQSIWNILTLMEQLYSSGAGPVFTDFYHFVKCVFILHRHNWNQPEADLGPKTESRLGQMPFSASEANRSLMREDELQITADNVSIWEADYTWLAKSY